MILRVTVGDLARRAIVGVVEVDAFRMALGDHSIEAVVAPLVLRRTGGDGGEAVAAAIVRERRALAVTGVHRQRTAQGVVGDRLAEEFLRRAVDGAKLHLLDDVAAAVEAHLDGLPVGQAVDRHQALGAVVSVNEFLAVCVDRAPWLRQLVELGDGLPRLAAAVLGGEAIRLHDGSSAAVATDFAGGELATVGVVEALAGEVAA